MFKIIYQVGSVCKEAYDFLGYKGIAALIAVFVSSIAAMELHEKYFPEKTITIPTPIHQSAPENPAPEKFTLDSDLENKLNDGKTKYMGIKPDFYPGMCIGTTGVCYTVVGDQAAAEDVVAPSGK